MRVELLDRSAADEMWQAAVDHNVGDQSWGFLSYGDAPAAVGGGFGGFAWFESREALLSFVEAVLPVSPPSSRGVDPETLAAKLADLLSTVRNSGLGLDEADLEPINAVLRGSSQLTWWGQFGDLRAGRGQYGAALLQEFRDEVSGDGPVQQGEVTAFKEFLELYGS